jgi:hypothetical protein
MRRGIVRYDDRSRRLQGQVSAARSERAGSHRIWKTENGAEALVRLLPFSRLPCTTSIELGLTERLRHGAVDDIMRRLYREELGF